MFKIIHHFNTVACRVKQKKINFLVITRRSAAAVCWVICDPWRVQNKRRSAQVSLGAANYEASGAFHFISYFFFHILVLHTAVLTSLWNQGLADGNACSSVNRFNRLLLDVVSQVCAWNSFPHLFQVLVSLKESTEITVRGRGVHCFYSSQQKGENHPFSLSGWGALQLTKCTDVHKVWAL